ncbi:anti-sigma factor antagonist [Zongyangia hominis]|uniref:Anti-sigma factor antagonist n=1 Tax=Zongyangia hominis TaxID=2763677 RepID=A0A926ED50_9FIRM|nr:anti-sigma factor antagonist [Zongyangia hominis]MBC8570214.1 anti-sigma factor antagonist [Zongyangia hominis]
MLRIETAQELMMVFLIGEIDHHSAKAMREEIDTVAERVRPGTLILDFSDVSFMDSSGIGLVMGRVRLMKSFGGEVKIQGAKGNIRKVMQIAGLHRVARMDDEQ